MNDPYATLGIGKHSTPEEAKAAYRKLAMLHHPDRDGDEEKFKAVKEAYEFIESGKVFQAPPEPPASSQGQSYGPYKSSFTGGTPPRRPPPTPKPGFGKAPNWGTAGKPAQGYEARNRPPPIPIAARMPGGHIWGVTIEVTERQAFEGVTVPFRCDGMTFLHWIRPGSESSTFDQVFTPEDEMIGSSRNRPFSITVTLKVAQKEAAQLPSNHEVSIDLFALGLFTGGSITTKDAFEEAVSVHIPPGYNPDQPIVVPGRGFGSDKRGDLIVRIKPTFKLPSELNSGELKQLQRLNELATK